jgi:hypothetical protein
MIRGPPASPNRPSQRTGAPDPRPWQDARRCADPLDPRRGCPAKPQGPYAPSGRLESAGAAAIFPARDCDHRHRRPCGEWRGPGDAAPWPDGAPAPAPAAWPLLPPPAGFALGWPGSLPDLGPALSLSLAGGWQACDGAPAGAAAAAALHLHPPQPHDAPADLSALLAAAVRQRQMEDQLQQSRLCLLASLLPQAGHSLLAGAGGAGAGRPGLCLPPLLGAAAGPLGGPADRAGGAGPGAGLLQALLQSAAAAGSADAGGTARAAAVGPTEEEDNAADRGGCRRSEG